MSVMVCLVCPRGCRLSVGDAPGFEVTGNACPRGASYGRSESTDPRRTVTATCGVAGNGATGMQRAAGIRRVPVKTSAPIPKDRARELAAFIQRMRVNLPSRAGVSIVVFCGVSTPSHEACMSR